ncbi:hypothetical protein AOX55_0000931 [Sinorhizobium fredii CCBAU 25509]|nr:hypothetical protein AOX55_0000931 [Sinorhizobium fredii CCBAU 25509]
MEAWRRNFICRRASGRAEKLSAMRLGHWQGFRWSPAGRHTFG